VHDTSTFPTEFGFPKSLPHPLFFHSSDIDFDARLFAARVEQDKDSFDEKWSSLYIKRVTEGYTRIGVNATPCFLSTSQFDTLYGSEQGAVVYRAALNNLPVVSPESLSYEQLIEFRRDEDSVRRYRDLRLWLEQSLNGKTLSEATDIIGQKLDDYGWAIKKHGLKTITGTFSQILNWKQASMTGAVALAGGALAGEIGAAFAAGLVIASQVGASIAERMIEHEDLTRGKDREVAIIYDIRKRFG